MLNRGQKGSVQILPEAAIDAIRYGGKAETFAKAGYDLCRGGAMALCGGFPMMITALCRARRLGG